MSSSLVRRGPTAAGPLPSEPRPAARGGYGWPFWSAYLSNTILSLSFAVLFRYADFVAVAGGTEFHLGWIVGIGMIGSIATRLFLGSSIDRYGTRPIWLGCLVVHAAICFGQLAITSCTGVPVYVVRVLYCCAFAGAIGAAYTFASHQAPPKRMAEVYGILGTASMVGYLLGTQLSDFTLGLMEVSRASVEWMFLLGGVLGLLAIPFAWLATGRESLPKASETPALLEVLRRYQPGVSVLAVYMAMGMILGVLYAFLRSYAASLGIQRIGLFFSVCAIVVVLTRFPTRRWPERFGNRPIILLGTVTMVVSQLAFLPVQREWQLLLPAVVFGCAQSILYPALSAEAAQPFPVRHRGLAVTLMFAVADLGSLVGSPLAGTLVRVSASLGWPPYAVLFTVLAALMAVVGLWYAWTSRPKPR